MIFSRTPLRPSGSGWSLCTCQLPSNSSAQPLTPWSTHRGSTARTQSLRAWGLVRNNLKLIHSRLRSGLRVWSEYTWINLQIYLFFIVDWNIESTIVGNRLEYWINYYFGINCSAEFTCILQPCTYDTYVSSAEEIVEIVVHDITCTYICVCPV